MSIGLTQMLWWFKTSQVLSVRVFWKYADTEIGHFSLIYSAYHQPFKFNSYNWALSIPNSILPPWAIVTHVWYCKLKATGTGAGMLAVLFKFTRHKYHITIKKSFGRAYSSVSFHKFPKTVKDNADELNYHLLLLEHAARKD